MQHRESAHPLEADGHSNPLSTLSTERKVNAGFAVALACLALVGVSSYFTVRELREMLARALGSNG